MAVQGAAPNRTAPARYSRAISSGIKALKKMKKNSQATANMLKGLISQLTVSVIVKPLGILMAFTMLPKSIFSIIGKIIIHIKMAMGMETLAYSSLPRNSGTRGKNLPRAMPATMHKATHKVR